MATRKELIAAVGQRYREASKGERKGQWAMTVSGNWRITFRFEGEDVIAVNLEDYH